MKTLKQIGIFSLVAITIYACKPDQDVVIPKAQLDQDLAEILEAQSNGAGLDYFRLPDDGEINAIPQDPKNPISTAKIELGKFLFHETALGVKSKFDASDKTFSCATCHHEAAGFQAGRMQGISDGGIGFGAIGEARIKDPNCPIDSVDVQPIRSPSILNSAYQEATLWNGQFGATGVNAGTQEAWTEYTPKAVNHLGYEGVETQAIAGQNVHRLDVNLELFDQTVYRSLFVKAFGLLPDEELFTQETMGLAIAAYERVVVANQAPFQQWLRGNFKAMTDQQKEGAKLFFGKANCSSCHTGPALNSMEFHALGMADFDESQVLKGVDEATKKGRGGFTGNPEDDYKFKVPQLYNLKQSPFYGHGGSFTSIEAVVRYKNEGIAENPIVPESQLSPMFEAKNLNDEEIKAITAFISEGLFDPNLTRFVPDNLPSGLCFPVADANSLTDLGCY